MFEVSPVFAANYNSTKSICVNQGGTSSGKTYSILQVIFAILAQSEDKICTVVGQDIPNLKAGALRDALDIYNKSEMLKNLVQSYNKTDRIFQFNNGSIVEFKSYEDLQDAKSGKRDFLFVNEANGIPYPVYEQLSIRTKIREFIDYNPNAEFWVHEHLIGKQDVQLIISDHRHNKWVPQRIRDQIEGLKDKDYELWKVYGRGLTGKIEGLIYRNWDIVESVPESAQFIGLGMDFGFTNDPTTGIRVYKSDGELYLDEIIYSTGLTNTDIMRELLAKGHGRKDGIVADSADPKSIREIELGAFKIEGAEKGPDSILNGIDILKRYKINVTRRSLNLRKELLSYKWKVDKVSGKSINEPVDAFNHALDAVRYVALNKLKASNRPLKTNF